MKLQDLNIKTFNIKILGDANYAKIYKIQVDSNITFNDLKKIMNNACHLTKHSYKLFFIGNLLSNEYNFLTLDHIFPNIQDVDLEINLIVNKLDYEEEDICMPISLNFNNLCNIHKPKNLFFYCFTCKQSICSQCINEAHKYHRFYEKLNLIAPAELLIEKIFKDNDNYILNVDKTCFAECIKLKNIIKNKFDNIHKSLKIFEDKIIGIINSYIDVVLKTHEIYNTNIKTLETMSKEYFIKLKNFLGIKNIIINDNIFLGLYNKLDLLSKYKIQYFEFNIQKFKEINNIIVPLSKNLEDVLNDISEHINVHVDKDLDENIKKFEFKPNIEELTNEHVYNFFFNDANKIISQDKFPNLNIIKRFNNDFYLSKYKDYNCHPIYSKIFGDDFYNLIIDKDPEDDIHNKTISSNKNIDILKKTKNDLNIGDSLFDDFNNSVFSFFNDNNNSFNNSFAINNNNQNQ